MRFAELFAGAGGLSLGLEQAGHQCLWHAEIEKHACAVLRHRWPDVPLYGDVSQLDGRELVTRHGPLDLLSGGSPCQDLSVAGKRAGLGGKRSGLFYEQARLWRETEAPLLLWENVPGALSSNNGDDFTLILEELSGTSCARPDDGWPSAGVVHGPDGRARVAYRVLDLQWFGPPQRRRRVFLLAVADHALDRYDPAALLFADAAGGHTGSPDRTEVHPEREGVSGDLAASGTAGEGTAGPAAAGVAIFEHHGQDSRVKLVEVASTFGTNKGKAQEGHLVVPTVAWWDGREVAPTLDQSQLVKGQMMPDKDRFPVALNISNGEPRLSDTLGTMRSRPSGHDVGAQMTAVMAPTPRRLTPLECERLMGWPDGHTATGTREDGTVYALSDSARYRLCGNGVGSPCTRWIGQVIAGRDITR